MTDERDPFLMRVIFNGPYSPDFSVVVMFLLGLGFCSMMLVPIIEFSTEEGLPILSVGYVLTLIIGALVCRLVLGRVFYREKVPHYVPRSVAGAMSTLLCFGVALLLSIIEVESHIETPVPLHALIETIE